MTLPRPLLTTVLATLLLGASGAAQLTASKEVPFLSDPPVFGTGVLDDPVDVAVLSWCGPVSWAFVADAGSQAIVRWVITPSGTAVLPSAWVEFLVGPWGVAVNDIPGHPHQETLYATGTDLTGVPSILVFDKWGNLLNRFRGTPGDNLIDPQGIAVGPLGQVYVADRARRVVEEFDPLDVLTFNQSTRVNAYGGCTSLVPFDVSVDLMRRVQVAGNQYVPFPVGFAEIHRYGETCPTTTVSTPLTVGIDARDLCRTRDSTSDATVDTMSWTGTVWPTYLFSAATTQSIPVAGAAAADLGGLETQRTWRVSGAGLGGDRRVRCDQRVYVTDRGDGEVHVLETKKLSAALPDDAVAWWTFDEDGGTTAKDILNARHGTWTGSGLAPSEGVVRCALTFDGGASGVEVPDHPVLDVGLSDFSLEAWIRAEPQVGLVTFIDSRSLAGVGYRAFLDGGQLGFAIDDGTTSHTTTSAAAVDDGKWHHVAMTVTRGAATRLFVDGDLVATGASGGVTGSLSSGAGLSLGRDNPSGTTGLLGGLDEVTLYHRALADTEIADIDFAECAGKDLPALVIVEGPSLGGLSATLLAPQQDDLRLD